MQTQQNPTDLAQEVERRAWMFHESFGEDGFFDESIVKCLEAIHALCELIFGHEAADSGFDEMLSSFFADTVATVGWRKTVEEEYHGLYSSLPIGTLFHDLEAYAEHGIVLQQIADLDERRSVLKNQVALASSLLDLMPVEAWGLKAEHLMKVAYHSRIRWKLDNGEPVNGYELSAVSGLALQTVKNNLGNEEKAIVGNMRRIEAKEALAWLATKGFKDSIWKLQGHDETQAMPLEPISNIAFVPVATDGSVFGPHLRQDGLFRVGSDTHEEKVGTFKEALAVLQSAAIPIWRRPTEKGRWTRVRGVGWKRMTQAELDRLSLV